MIASRGMWKPFDAWKSFDRDMARKTPMSSVAADAAAMIASWQDFLGRCFFHCKRSSGGVEHVH